MPLNLDDLMGLYGLNSFTPGKEFKIMQINGIKMTTNICYEDIIPNFILDSLNVKGTESNIIINGTNDSWFGKSIEPKMHLHIAGFRSIETRKTLVRATCTGYSGVFDPTGNLTYKTQLGEKESFVKEVPLMEIKTIYRQGGWFFVYALGLIVLIIFIFAVVRKIQFYFIKSKKISSYHHKKRLSDIWYD